jgi:hypothetical protein
VGGACIGGESEWFVGGFVGGPNSASRLALLCPLLLKVPAALAARSRRTAASIGALFPPCIVPMGIAPWIIILPMNDLGFGVS